MRPASCLLLAVPIVAAAMAAASGALAQVPGPNALPPPPTERVVMRLDYHGAPGCADPEPFVLALTPRVHGWDPLGPNPTWRLVVTVKRRRGYEGTVELYDPKGSVAWSGSYTP